MNTNQVVLPPAKDIVIDGKVCGKVTYHDMWGDGKLVYAAADLGIEAWCLPALPAAHECARYTRIYVNLDDKRWQVSNFEEATLLLTRAHEKQELLNQQAEFRAELGNLEAEAGWLSALRPFQTRLRAALDRVHKLSAYKEPSTLNSVRKAIRALREELERLQAVPSLELLVDGLTSGLFFYGGGHSNKQTLKELTAIEIRSGGMVPCPDPREVFRTRLEKANVIDLEGLDEVDLRIDVHHYAPHWVFQDPDIEWAPESIPYPEALIPPSQDNPRLQVEYTYDGEGEQRQAVAHVVVPRSAFGQKEKKKETLTALEQGTLMPTLPHDIKWWIHVECAHKSVEGLQDEALAAMVRNLPAR